MKQLLLLGRLAPTRVMCETGSKPRGVAVVCIWTATGCPHRGCGTATNPTPPESARLCAPAKPQRGRERTRPRYPLRPLASSSQGSIGNHNGLPWSLAGRVAGHSRVKGARGMRSMRGRAGAGGGKWAKGAAASQTDEQKLARPGQGQLQFSCVDPSSKRAGARETRGATGLGGG